MFIFKGFYAIASGLRQKPGYGQDLWNQLMT